MTELKTDLHILISIQVDNLTYRTTPDDLRRVFERCGEVGDIYIPRDRYTRESRGFAFVRWVMTKIDRMKSAWAVPN